MAITQDELKQEGDDYAAAFNEDPQPAAEQSEDAAFGLDVEAATGGDGEGEAPAVSEGEAAEGEAPAVAVVIAGEPAEGDGGGDAPAEGGMDLPGDEDTGSVDEPAGDDGFDPAKERQRLKSWEGRLKALEAQLKGSKTEVEPAASEALEDVAEGAEASGDTELAAAAEQASDAVESGEMTAADAMKMLADDFGEDFVKMIEVIATAKAKEAGGAAAAEKVSEIGKTVDEIINDIVDTKTRTHFERIAEKHPDFAEINDSPAFQAWAAEDPERQRIAQSGSAKEIVGMLDEYKASAGSQPEPEVEVPAAGADPEVTAAMDDAEGVRSSGMRLPEQPTPSGYEDAWDKF